MFESITWAREPEANRTGSNVMKPGVTAVLLLGFGALLLLIGVLGIGTIRRVNEMQAQLTSAQRDYANVDSAIRDLPADLHLAGLLVRDYVIDPNAKAATGYKQQLTTVQNRIESHLKQLELLRSLQEDKVNRLQKETQAYVDSLDPMLGWSNEEKLARSYAVIQGVLIPRRQAIVNLAQELGGLNAQNLATERASIERSRQALRSFVSNLLAVCLGLGLAVALVSTRRVVSSERKLKLERERAEEAERQQHRLAMRVVQVQEDERKRIALELHDAVGQMASALGMELGRLESLSLASADRFREKLAEVKGMNSDVIRAVKELATGLRPAMLDQLGLGPALRSHAREFSRRTNVPTDVQLEGEPDHVPEPYRTCVYRIVQEALNNCARHARAKNCSIALSAGPEWVGLVVRDDGVGFDADRKSKTGLGLLGISERVRDLNGTVKIASKPGQGVLLEVRIPLKEPLPV